jgi:hypothetical protein
MAEISYDIPPPDDENRPPQYGQLDEAAVYDYVPAIPADTFEDDHDTDQIDFYGNSGASVDWLGTAEASGLPSFRPYEKYVADIDAKLAAGFDPRHQPDEFPGFIAHGTTCLVFEVPDADNPNIANVLKLPRITLDGEVDPWPAMHDENTVRDEYIGPLMRVWDEPGYEQFVTGKEGSDRQIGGVVCQRVPGRSLATYTQSELDAIPPEDWQGLVIASSRAPALGVSLDTKIGNLNRHSNGITILDPHIYEAPLLPESEELQVIQAAASYVVPWIFTAGWKGPRPNSVPVPGQILRPPTTAGRRMLAVLRQSFGPLAEAIALSRWDEYNVDTTDIVMARTALELPDDIHYLLDHMLPSDIWSANTQFRHLLGRPDLLVRHNDVDSQSITEGNEAARMAWLYGLPILPSAVVEHNDKTYVVTKRVEGTGLLEVLHHNPSPELLSQVDIAWGAQVRNLISCKQNGRTLPEDIGNPKQWMVGRLRPEPGETADTSDQLWLVDLPCKANPRQGLSAKSFDHIYMYELDDIVKHILYLEQVGGQPLMHTRVAMRAALTRLPDTEPFKWRQERIRGLLNLPAYKL